MSTAFAQPAKTASAIILHDEPLNIIPREFYVKKVTDDRHNRGAVALLLIADKATKKTTPVTADLENGTLFCLNRFIANNLPRNPSLRPVVISLEKFTVTETASAGNRAAGEVVLNLGFYLDKGEEDMVHLADYKGNATYNRNTGEPQMAEPIIRHVIEDGLSYLNNWMNKQADSNIKLAKGVKVTFSDYQESPEGDSIYYSRKRPLTWKDFQSKIPSGRYDAEVYPTIGYNEHAEIVKGIVNLNIAVKVCLPKSACWVKDGSKTSYTLNHEQRHFDIVKIVAERFKKRINAQVLPVDNYDGFINVEYFDSYREMTDLQKLYDTETAHGTNIIKQQLWNEKIDHELGLNGIR